MNTKPLRFSFEPFASVQFNEGLAQVVDKHPAMFVQCLDAYSFQRELIIKWCDTNKSFVIHSYMHPGLANFQYVKESLAKKAMDKFASICLKYPNILFNNDSSPRALGFVAFHNACLAGIDPALIIKRF